MAKAGVKTGGHSTGSKSGGRRCGRISCHHGEDHKQGVGDRNQPVSIAVGERSSPVGLVDGFGQSVSSSVTESLKGITCSKDRRT